MRRKKVLAALAIALLIGSAGVIKCVPLWFRTCPFNPSSYTPLPSNVPLRILTFVNVTSFVQPEDELIQETLKDILKHKPPFSNNAEAIRNWVAGNIEYGFDPINWLTAERKNLNPLEYWQYPRETIKSKSGDCEDFAILLCSLLRVSGYSSKEVYVVLAKCPRGGHGFVALKESGEWRYIEPQAKESWWGYDAWMVDQKLNQCEVSYIFNDKCILIPKSPLPPPEEKGSICSQICYLRELAGWAMERLQSLCLNG